MSIDTTFCSNGECPLRQKCGRAREYSFKIEDRMPHLSEGFFAEQKFKGRIEQGENGLQYVCDYQKKI